MLGGMYPAVAPLLALSLLAPMSWVTGGAEPIAAAPRATRAAGWDTGSAGAPGSVTATWPLAGRPSVVKSFDPPASAYAAGHRGVDLAGAPGETVAAAAAGTVTYAGSLAGRGVVVVSHGATRTTYEPVRATVGVGAQVTAGEAIGTLQLSPSSHCWPAACLHWGLIEGDTYLDPLSLVGAGPVRLLPLWS